MKAGRSQRRQEFPRERSASHSPTVATAGDRSAADNTQVRETLSEDGQKRSADAQVVDPPDTFGFAWQQGRPGLCRGTFSSRSSGRSRLPRDPERGWLRVASWRLGRPPSTPGLLGGSSDEPASRSVSIDGPRHARKTTCRSRHRRQFVFSDDTFRRRAQMSTASQLVRYRSWLT